MGAALKKAGVSPLRSGTTDRLLEHWGKYGRVFVQTAEAKQVKDELYYHLYPIPYSVKSDSVKFLIDLIRMKKKVMPPSESHPVTYSPGQYIRFLKQMHPKILDTFHYPSNAETKPWCTAKYRESPQQCSACGGTGKVRRAQLDGWGAVRPRKC